MDQSSTNKDSPTLPNLESMTINDFINEVSEEKKAKSEFVPAEVKSQNIKNENAEGDSGNGKKNSDSNFTYL